MTKRRHRLLTLLLAGMALALTVPAAAGAKTFAWSAPTSVAGGKGTTFVGQLACPSATGCTAAGELLGADYDGYLATFSPLAPGTVTPVKIATNGLEPRFSAVSCPAASQCTAVAGGNEWTYDPASLSGATSASGYARFISCPTTTECVSVQQGNYGPGNPDPYPNGVVVFSAFNPQSPAAHTDTVIDTGTQSSQPNSIPNTLFALACPSTTQCTLIGSNATDGVAYTFDPTVPSSPTPTVVDPGLGDVSSAHLACPTATECVLVDRVGHEVTFNPQSPGTPSQVLVDATGLYGRRDVPVGESVHRHR